jgi:hypothetical protein
MDGSGVLINSSIRGSHRVWLGATAEELDDLLESHNDVAEDGYYPFVPDQVSSNAGGGFYELPRI